MERVSGTGTVAPIVASTEGAEGTRALAAALVAHCRAGDVVLLVGGLGAGKTTFAQGAGRELGVDEPVTSPTFTLVRQYPLPGRGAGPRVLVHADVYRLDSLQEVVDLGLGELAEDGGVALVEWGDVAEPVIGRDALTVRLDPGDHDDRRTVTVSASGPIWKGRWQALTAALAPWAADR